MWNFCSYNQFLDPQGGANGLVINSVNLNRAINFYIGDGAIDEQGRKLKPKVACDRRKKERKNCIGGR
jgi:hypothetical protein